MRMIMTSTTNGKPRLFLEDKTISSLEDAVIVGSSKKTVSKLTPQEQGAMLGTNLIKTLAVYIMKKFGQIFLISTVVVLAPIAGLAEDNQLTKAISEIQQENIVAPIAEEKKGFWAGIKTITVNTIDSSKRVVSRMKNPDEVAEAQALLIKELEAKVKSLRKYTVQRQVTSEYDYRNAWQCSQQIKEYIKDTKPSSSLTTPSTISGVK